ncbi:MAG: putative alpha/beta superfamily hydrolase [Paraglaciecola sp.]|jgi:predicted alpha/beta superfamily hydrolase
MLKEVKQYFFNFFHRKAKFILVEREKIAIHQYNNLNSKKLKRKIRFDVYLPPAYETGEKKYPVLFFNDGQDMEAVQLAKTLHTLYQNKEIEELIIVAVHAADRMQEYGVQRQADYAGRGSQAWSYSKFLLGELRPYIMSHYRCETAQQKQGIAGFSLGGLSAMDIAWNHGDIFGKVGVFSGALWWRSKAFSQQNPDAHRLMHEIVAKGPKRDDMKFWFQTGTNDEDSDRNNNGIIDSIDDTLDLIDELTKVGYDREQDIHYYEIIGGYHNQYTWGKAMPEFLKWAFRN